MKVENNKKFLVSKKRILSGLAKWAIAQSPYYRPDNLEVVIDKLNTNITCIFELAELGYLDLTYDEIVEFINTHTKNIPEFMLWNERKNGNQSPFGFVSAYSHPVPDDDFIDLDALVRNVANDIIREDYQKPIPEILSGKKLYSDEMEKSE